MAITAMRIVTWVITLLLFIAGIACAVDALTTAHSVWLSIPMLILSGVLFGPGLILLAALLGLYQFAIEVNGHRLEVRRRDEP
jgi:hypothetical protein